MTSCAKVNVDDAYRRVQIVQSSAYQLGALLTEPVDVVATSTRSRPCYPLQFVSGLAITA